MAMNPIWLSKAMALPGMATSSFTTIDAVKTITSIGSIEGPEPQQLFQGEIAIGSLREFVPLPRTLWSAENGRDPNGGSLMLLGRSNATTKPWEEPNYSFRRAHFYPLPRDLCFPEEKPLFMRWARGKKRLVEIGVFEGASASLFRSVMDPKGSIWLIDPFVPDSRNPHLRARKIFAWLNVARVRNGETVWFKDYSYNVVGQKRDPIDFLFIDGDHTEVACLRDWQDWSPFVEVGGIVIFHDARFGTSDGKYWDGWEGPTNVVNRLFRGSERLPNWQIVEEVRTAVVVQRIK